MKNLKLNIVLLAMGLIFMVSCKDEEKTAEATPENTETTTTTSATGNDEEVRLNPAHGEPGHRCDMPVGAPLDGSAGNTQNTNSAGDTQSSSVSPVRVDRTPATPAVNPPHGEPGHDCAVPVGAPLDDQD